MSNRDAAGHILDQAWEALPAEHRALLEAIGYDQTAVVARGLGREVDDLYQSAGLPRVGARDRRRLDEALGVWVPGLRVVLVNVAHDALEGLDMPSFEAAIARVAWHEWGHALSVHRASEDDVSAGQRLLESAPSGIAETVRAGGYGPRDVTHELVAETYATLLARRMRGGTGKPSWLSEEIWDLVTGILAWSP